MLQEMVDQASAEIVQTGLQRAKEGKDEMLKQFLRLILPKQRLLEIELPEIHSASDAADAALVISEKLGIGELSPSEAADLMRYLESQVRIVQAVDHEYRLASLEAKLAEGS